MPMLRRSAVGTMLAADSMPAASSVSIGIWIPYGSRCEKPQQRGFFHFIEHMLFKGTHKHDARELARIFERTGGFVNAFCERSVTCVHCTVPSDVWKQSCETLLEMAFLSSFPESEFQKEKAVIISEILQTDDDPEELAHEHFFQRFWPGQTIGLPIAGKVDEVQAIARDELFLFYKSIFSFENAFVSIAGCIEESNAIESIERMLEQVYLQMNTEPDYSSSPSPQLPLTPPLRPELLPLQLLQVERAQPQQFALYEKKPLALSYAIRGAQAPLPIDLRNYLIDTIINEMLGGSTISRLFQRLREDKGLCYTVYSSYETEAVESLWIIHLQSAKKLLPAALDLLEEETFELARTPFSRSEFDDAFERVKGLIVLTMDDSDYRQRRMARQFFSHGQLESTLEELACVSTIGYDEIAVASMRLAQNPSSRFVFGAISEREMQKRGYLESEGF